MGFEVLASFLPVFQAQMYTKHDTGSYLQDVQLTLCVIHLHLKTLLSDRVDVYCLL